MANKSERRFNGSVSSNTAAMVNKRRGKQIFLPILLVVALHYFGAANATEESLAGPFAATSHNQGNIFEIVANVDIKLIRFDINIDAGTGTIRITTREGVEGRVVSPGDSGWTLVNEFAGVVGQGKNNVTPLPDFSPPFVITAGTKQAFYITTDESVNIWHHSGTSYENVYASNEDLELLEGYSVGSANGYTVLGGPKRWNGNVYYEVMETSTGVPSLAPSLTPSVVPSSIPTSLPSLAPSSAPSNEPSLLPSLLPSYTPSNEPSLVPSLAPSDTASNHPSSMPSVQPSVEPSMEPSVQPSREPSLTPSMQPSGKPSLKPTSNPSLSSDAPSHIPSLIPSIPPSHEPSDQPSAIPSLKLSAFPSSNPSVSPSKHVSGLPSLTPSAQPSGIPSFSLSSDPSSQPSANASLSPSSRPPMPSAEPSKSHSLSPSTLSPSTGSVLPSSSMTPPPYLNPTSVPPSKNPSVIEVSLPPTTISTTVSSISAQPTAFDGPASTQSPSRKSADANDNQHTFLSLRNTLHKIRRDMWGKFFSGDETDDDATP